MRANLTNERRITNPPQVTNLPHKNVVAREEVRSEVRRL
jgi:hypothetical protein